MQLLSPQLKGYNGDWHLCNWVNWFVCVPWKWSNFGLCHEMMESRADWHKQFPGGNFSPNKPTVSPGFNCFWKRLGSCLSPEGAVSIPVMHRFMQGSPMSFYCVISTPTPHLSAGFSGGEGGFGMIWEVFSSDSGWVQLDFSLQLSNLP